MTGRVASVGGMSRAAGRVASVGTGGVDPVRDWMEESVAISLFGGGKRIFHEGCDGHRADAAGYRGDIAASGGDFCKVDVAFEGEAAFFGSVGDAGDADVDHDSAGFDHGAMNEFRFPEGGYDDIPLQADLPEVAGLGVAGGDGTVAGLGVGAQQNAHGPADNIAAADHYRVHSAGVDLIMLEQQEDAVGGCGDKGRQPLDHFADVDGVEAVDVFGRVDRVDYVLVGDMPGQR